jgi:hypothetical protein
MSDGFDFWQEPCYLGDRGETIEMMALAERNFWSRCQLRPDGTRTNKPRVKPRRRLYRTLEQKRFEETIERLNEGKK